MKLTVILLFNIKFGETTDKGTAHGAVTEGTVPPVLYHLVQTKKEETPVVLRGINLEKKGLEKRSGI